MSFLLPKSQERPNQRPPRRVEPASIIAVGSGKGGVGKTFMSITLASAMAQAGKRTLLVDGDLGLANVDVQLGIAPETDGRLDVGCHQVGVVQSGGGTPRALAHANVSTISA